jgi:DNA-binding NarL/FixJ family response regulator
MADPNQPIRVLIADQQSLFRQGIRSVLTKEENIEVCGEVDSGQEVLTVASVLLPDVILLDINLPPGGLDLTKAIKRQLPQVAVVIISPQSSNEELFEVIKARAAGYIYRDIEFNELVDNIRKSANGGHPINDTFLSRPQVAQKVLEQFQELSWGKELESLVSPLTPRETEILSYMAQGFLNKQIAVTLNISEQTIKNHITSILRKLDANARTQAVVTAIKRGLITLNPENMKRIKD